MKLHCSLVEQHAPGVHSSTTMQQQEWPLSPTHLSALAAAWRLPSEAPSAPAISATSSGMPPAAAVASLFCVSRPAAGRGRMGRRGGEMRGVGVVCRLLHGARASLLRGEHMRPHPCSPTQAASLFLWHPLPLPHSPRLRSARAACCFAASVPLRSTPTSSGMAPAGERGASISREKAGPHANGFAIPRAEPAAWLHQWLCASAPLHGELLVLVMEVDSQGGHAGCRPLWPSTSMRSTSSRQGAAERHRGAEVKALKGGVGRRGRHGMRAAWPAAQQATSGTLPPHAALHPTCAGNQALRLS